MLKKCLFLITLLLFSSANLIAQEKEVNPPYNIKTISFVDNGTVSIPIFELGEVFQLQFDDLNGSEDSYYYRITHCDYDWKQSQLSKSEYLIGLDEQPINNYTNSLNTLQIYSHYVVAFPNNLTQLKVSGNYIISVLNYQREVVFSRKVIIYEDLVAVPLQIRRSRVINDLDYKHDLDFAIKSDAINFQSPLKNVKVLLMQNGKFNNAITDVRPMYTIGNDLIYKYDIPTQFWAGNEYLYFDNNNIQAASNNIARVDGGSGLYGCYLHTNEAKAQKIYSFGQDINGGFQIIKINADNNDIEADYAWIYFSLSAPAFYQNKDVYITGMFNNYILNSDNKMDYNEKKGIYEKAIMIKQGFTNYSFTVADSTGKIDEEHAIDGNFWQTENNYFVMVYYRENNQRYDRIIGRGIANSNLIIN